MINAKKSLSSCQLARDLDLTQPTALLMQYKIRAAMISKQQPLLNGIVEADEIYVGGKPRKSIKHNTPPRMGNPSVVEEPIKHLLLEL